MYGVCGLCRWLFVFFFFKQKTAYEMRISDWSSDVCSSDLRIFNEFDLFPGGRQGAVHDTSLVDRGVMAEPAGDHQHRNLNPLRILCRRSLAEMGPRTDELLQDRKCTRLNSSH